MNLKIERLKTTRVYSVSVLFFWLFFLLSSKTFWILRYHRRPSLCSTISEFWLWKRIDFDFVNGESVNESIDQKERIPLEAPRSWRRRKSRQLRLQFRAPAAQFAAVHPSQCLTVYSHLKFGILANYLCGFNAFNIILSFK